MNNGAPTTRAVVNGGIQRQTPTKRGAVGTIRFWLAYTPAAGLAVLMLLPVLALATAGLFVLTVWLLVVSAVQEGRRRHGELHRGGR